MCLMAKSGDSSYNDAWSCLSSVALVQLLLARGASAESASAALDQGVHGDGAEADSSAFGQTVQRDRTTVDSTGATAEGAVADRAVLGAQRSVVLRAARLQHPVSLVPGHESAGKLFRCLDVQQEPRAPRQGRCRFEVLRRRRARGASVAAALRRTLQRGRHADRGVGLDEVVPGQGWWW